MTMRPATVITGALALSGAAWAVAHLRSPAARTWRRGTGRRTTAGPLAVRRFGDPTGPVVLLLHGLVGSGESFGAGFDVLGGDHDVIVPDLLGFGRSRAARTVGYTAEDHCRAIDAALDACEVTGRPVAVAGHSMGGVLALRWAAAALTRRPGTVRSVSTWSAPLYDDPEEAHRGLRHAGRFEAAMTGNGPLAGGMCAWMCRHRRAAAALTVVASPSLPVPVAVDGVQHTWASYTGSLHSLVLDSRWRAALASLTAAGTPITLTHGAADRVPVPGRAVLLAAHHRGVTARIHPTADHQLPLVDPAWCVADLAARRGE